MAASDWPAIFANDLASEFEGVPVYSNVDPTREYNGGKSIEFNVQSFETTPLLSGGFYYDFQLVAACRAKTFEEAAELVDELREALGPEFASLIQSGALYAAFITSHEVTPDARGLIEGESFYGLLYFNLTEKEGL